MPDDETLKGLDELSDRLDDVLDEVKRIGDRASTKPPRSSTPQPSSLQRSTGRGTSRSVTPERRSPDRRPRQREPKSIKQLNHLHRLRLHNHLTADEYDERRRQLLERLDELYDLD